MLRCEVALAGEKDIVVSRHRGCPVAFPELLILQYLHGPEAITEIAVVGEWDTSNSEMLEQLQVLYHEEAVTKVFPGNRPQMPLGDRSLPICRRPIHVPKPTRPESPDPRVKPLSQFT